VSAGRAGTPGDGWIAVALVSAAIGAAIATLAFILLDWPR